MKIELARPIAPTEDPKVINKRLEDYFGKFETGEANWKLFWSEEMFEKRLVSHTESGVQLLTPMEMTVRKAGYIKNRWVLCRLVPVPVVNRMEMLGAKTSYEPLWTFESEITKEPISPEWGVIRAIVSHVTENILTAEHKAPVKHPEELYNTQEAINERAKKLEEAMFGNETKLGDALAYDEAVGFGQRKRSDW